MQCSLGEKGDGSNILSAPKNGQIEYRPVQVPCRCRAGADVSMLPES